MSNIFILNLFFIIQVQWQRNGGKCGVCGDAWHLPSPRPNEAGGVYGRGIIVRKYKPGQVIKNFLMILKFSLTIKTFFCL